MQLAEYFDPSRPEGFQAERLPEHCRTPMMLHFISVKAKHPHCIVFYRMGDFYEMFFEDAETAARELDLTLTSRNREEDRRIPMCGVPHHAAAAYVRRLTELGYRVAICEQVGDPKESKSMVKREVTRVVTPSLVWDPMEADKGEEFLLVCVHYRRRQWNVVTLSTVTGQLESHQFSDVADVEDALMRLHPQEILMTDDAYTQISERLPQTLRRKCLRIAAIGGTRGQLENRCMRTLGVQSLEAFGLHTLSDEELSVLASTLSYLESTAPGTAWSHLRLSLRQPSDYVRVDAPTFEHLEVFHSSEGERESSLAGCFDQIATGPGQRLLRQTLLFPKQDPAFFMGRFERIAYWDVHRDAQDKVRATLGELSDVERLAQKAVMGTFHPANGRALAETLKACNGLRDVLPPAHLHMFEKRLDRLADIRDELDRTLEEVPALDSTRGRIIRVGIDAELDRMREIHDNAQGWLERFEQTQRSSTGINSLKVKYNRAFGFSIEVSRANAGKVPAFYQRRQTLVNGERYVTEDLLAFERDWLRAQETVVACEQRIFGGLVQRVREQATSLIELGEILAEWDVTQACAYLVSHKKFVLPEFVEDSRIELDGSRHPVLEKLEEPFVANDVCLDSSQRFLLLTGPNMSGKSTLMRQVGLATLSAYAGLPVAASRGVFGPVDSIFTRVGASDRLSKRQSTFMVEMIETATILRQATAKSLVIIDEIGRGTSTFDGMSIAWAVAEEIITALRPLTMFATHYHELVGLERAHDTVRTGELAIKEWEGEIIFLRKFQYGSSGKSYGINVARLAGLPPAVLERAAKKLEELSRSPRAQMPLPF